MTKTQSLLANSIVFHGHRTLSMAFFTLCTLITFPHLCWPENLVGIEERIANTSLLIDLTVEEPPKTISASGLFSNISNQTASPGLIPYSVNSPLWSDGTSKVRYMALPNHSQVKFSRNGKWAFPKNTVLVKSFYLDMIRDDPTTRRIIETRFLIKVGQTNSWQGFSYQWNDTGTDAELIEAGGTKRYKIIDSESPEGFTNLDYVFPASEDCSSCHTHGSGIVLGLRTSQLNTLHTHGEQVAHQLQTLNTLGVFSQDIGDNFDNFPRWENPADTTAPISGRARSYLAANCAHCHRPGGLRRTNIDLRYDTDLPNTGMINVSSQLDDLDELNLSIISPGDAPASILPLRMSFLNERRMPPLATTIVDSKGVGLVSRWINTLETPTAISNFSTVPSVLALRKSYPNPFNSTTTIVYTTPETNRVQLTIYDITGQRVRTLVSAEHSTGTHKIQWDGLDKLGKPVGSGVFLIFLQSEDETRSSKLTLLR